MLSPSFNMLMDGQFWCSSLHKYLQWCQDIHKKKLGTVSPQKQIIQWKDNLFESLVWLVPSTSLLTSYPEILPPDLCIACVHKACWRGGMWPEILVRQARSLCSIHPVYPSPHTFPHIQYLLAKISFRTKFQSVWKLSRQESLRIREQMVTPCD